MEQGTNRTAVKKQYTVSAQTAGYVDCLQELNNLMAHIVQVVETYSSRDVDEAMQPINEAAQVLQDKIITTLIAGSVAEATLYMNITEI